VIFPRVFPVRPRGGQWCDTGKRVIPQGSVFVRHDGTTLTYCLECAAGKRQRDRSFAAPEPARG
jgi:hypothetical protein